MSLEQRIDALIKALEDNTAAVLRGAGQTAISFPSSDTVTGTTSAATTPAPTAEPTAEPAPKRTRARKTESVAETPAAAPAEPAAPTPAPETKSDIQLTDLQQVAAALMDAKRTAEIRPIVTSFGVQRLTDLSGEQYAACLEKLKAALASGKTAAAAPAPTQPAEAPKAAAPAKVAPVEVVPTLDEITTLAKSIMASHGAVPLVEKINKPFGIAKVSAAPVEKYPEVFKALKALEQELKAA